MNKKRRKETQKSAILPETLGSAVDYLILSLEYEQKMLENIREPKMRKKKVISPISISI